MPKPKRGLRLPEGDDPEGMGYLIRDYVDWMRSRNYSEATVANRTAYLRRFMAWCMDRGLTRPTEITKPILERFQRYLYHYRQKGGQPLSFRSQAVQITALRGFFRFLTRSNRLLYNPGADLELPKVERRLPRAVLTVSEAEQVLAQPDIEDLYGLRDRAVLEVLYSCGLRRKELVNLSLYDLDQERATLHVRLGKGKKDRMVPIGERALAWVARYLDEVRPQLVVEPDSRYLFLTLYGQALSVSWLTDRVRQYVDQAELGKHGSCHLIPAHHGHADARTRGRHPLHPGDAGPRGPEDDPDLHHGLHQEAPGRARGHAPRGEARACGKSSRGSVRAYVRGRRADSFLSC